MADEVSSVDQFRLAELERKVTGLTDHAVSREWLDERLGRTEDAIKAMAREAAAARSEIERDVRELRDEARARRMTIYTAVVGSIIALIVGLVQTVPL